MNLLKQKTLLYAEDELDIQKQYAQYFKNYFKDVLLASNGQEALDIYHDKNPDVLILDINMPKLSGLEVTQLIRKSNKDISIILLTARSDKYTLFEAMELGLITYLEKPVSRDNLKKALQKLANKTQNTTIKNLWFYKDNYYTWNTKKQQLFYLGKNIICTKREIILLEHLISLNGVKVTYQNIYETVWHDDFDKEYNESTIKTLLSGLRAKLPPKAIKNAYGMGYYLNIY